jgi:hypothetical protein
MCIGDGADFTGCTPPVRACPYRRRISGYRPVQIPIGTQHMLLIETLLITGIRIVV